VTQIEDFSDWVRATMTVEQAEKLLQVRTNLIEKFYSLCTECASGIKLHFD